MANRRISEFGTFLLDFLYPLFPRESPDPVLAKVMSSGLRSLLDKKDQGDKSFLKVDYFFRFVVCCLLFCYFAVCYASFIT